MVDNGEKRYSSTPIAFLFDAVFGSADCIGHSRLPMHAVRSSSVGELLRHFDDLLAEAQHLRESHQPERRRSP